tara:strand:+ start:1828 stop:2751 length:924 start_codon:yes stop_codon:yes gene_type:complete
MTTGLQNYVVEETSDDWVLYHNNFSICSRKVRLCLEEIGLDYRSEHIDLIETGKYEVASKRFLKINPGATVPVLLHKGRPIYESHEQIYYLVEHTDNKNILPSSENDKENMDYWVEKSSLIGNPLKNQDKYAGNSVAPLTFPLFVAMMRYVPFKEIFIGLRTHPMKERVIGFFAFKTFGMKIFSSLFPFSKLLKSSFFNLNQHLYDLEKHLEGKKSLWIVGEEFTLADISWAVILHRFHECGWGNLLLVDKPFIKKYYFNLLNRESFKVAIDNASHPILTKGIDDLHKTFSTQSSLKEIYTQLEKSK